ncbi:MAG: ATP-binding cassette domain-containing protein [Clostridiales bacterium]|nr:ATP-binding cassette domain-containing protein [Clostridiales bacterium]
MNVLKAEGLTKRYSGFTLDNASFELQKGKITGFIGRNGAGKTTTLKSMLNIVHPDSGKVYFFGKEFALHAGCNRHTRPPKHRLQAHIPRRGHNRFCRAYRACLSKIRPLV